jgi:hypothetical protein
MHDKPGTSLNYLFDKAKILYWEETVDKYGVTGYTLQHQWNR